MSKTSIRNYVIAGIVAGVIVGCITLFYVYADLNYDIEGINTTGLQAYGNLTQQIENANQTVGKIYDTNAESGLFDILGDLVVKALASIKSFITGINFMFNGVSNMLGMGMLHIPAPIVLGIMAGLVVIIGGVILFKYISNKDDEI